jgi:hypothetical protein
MELLDAIIALEVAQDDFAADQFRQSRMRPGSRPSAWGPDIAALLWRDVQTAMAQVGIAADATWTPDDEAAWHAFGRWLVTL